MNNLEFPIFAAHIRSLTDPAMVAARDAGNHSLLAELYNADSATIYWRNAIPPSEYIEAVVPAEVAAMTAGEARVWSWITQGMSAPIDATSDVQRSWIAEAFGPATATRSALIALAKGTASVFEEIFATGAGTNASPSILGVTGPVTHVEIGRALEKF